jgi:glucose/arabinose dehydrogenase
MKRVFFASLASLALLAACSSEQQKSETKDEAPKAAAEAKGCASGAPALPGTGLCPEQALAFLGASILKTAESLPEGCTWSVNETMMGLPDEALIYQAASCKGKTTQLEMRAGARSASLGYVVSGVFDPVPADFEPVRIFTTEGQPDPKATILAMAKETTENKEEAAACEIRAFNPPGSAVLGDAFVIDVSAAYKTAKKIDPAEANVACGPYGVRDANSFWVIRQGHAWFVDHGQDLPDFNFDSIRWIKKGADGAWTVKP